MLAPRVLYFTGHDAWRANLPHLLARLCLHGLVSCALPCAHRFFGCIRLVSHILDLGIVDIFWVAASIHPTSLAKVVMVGGIKSGLRN